MSQCNLLSSFNFWYENMHLRYSLLGLSYVCEEELDD